MAPKAESTCCDVFLGDSPKLSDSSKCVPDISSGHSFLAPKWLWSILRVFVASGKLTVLLLMKLNLARKSVKIELDVRSHKISGKVLNIIIRLTMKYPLFRYIIGVLTHTTAWDGYWGGDEILKWDLINIASPHLTYQHNVPSLASSCLMDPRGSEGDPECIFLLLTHTNQLLLVTFCVITAGNRAIFSDTRTNGWTDRHRS